MANRFGAILTDDLAFPGLPTVAQWNLIKNAAALNAGGHVYDLHGIGVYTGWQPTASKTCSAGSGIVGTEGWVAETTEAAAITGLTDGIENYIFAAPNSDTIQAGDVDFLGHSTATWLAGYVLVGSITLSAASAVTHLNGVAIAETYADLWERDDLYQLKRGKAHGSGTTVELAADQASSIDISHTAQAAFAIPGAIAFTVESGWSFWITENAQDDQFSVTITNDTAYAATCAYSWIRRGIVG